MNDMVDFAWVWDGELCDWRRMTGPNKRDTMRAFLLLTSEYIDDYHATQTRRYLSKTTVWNVDERTKIRWKLGPWFYNHFLNMNTFYSLRVSSENMYSIQYYLTSDKKKVKQRVKQGE